MALVGTLRLFVRCLRDAGLRLLEIGGTARKGPIDTLVLLRSPSSSLCEAFSICGDRAEDHAGLQANLWLGSWHAARSIAAAVPETTSTGSSGQLSGGAPVGVGGQREQVRDGGPGRDEAVAVHRVHDRDRVAAHRRRGRVARVEACGSARGARGRRGVRRQAQHQVPIVLRGSATPVKPDQEDVRQATPSRPPRVSPSPMLSATHSTNLPRI